jgi:hypothetical protein
MGLPDGTIGLLINQYAPVPYCWRVPPPPSGTMLAFAKVKHNVPIVGEMGQCT